MDRAVSVNPLLPGNTEETCIMKHHTKDKGDVGVLKAQADLASKGYMVLLPLTEHAKFDLVVYKDQKFKRVQVKYRSVDSRGCVSVSFRSCWSDRIGIHMKATDKTEIDMYCLYCPETEQCFYFDPRKFKKSICLRVNPPKNGQKQYVHFASDYLKVP